MPLRKGSLTIASALAFLLELGAAGPQLTRPGHAAETDKAALDKIVALNKAALAAYDKKDFESAKERLLEAVVLGKETGLGRHASMARTYLHLGVVYVEGLKDTEKGVRYLGMALKLRSDIALTPALATKAVKAAFAQAGSGGATGEAAAIEQVAEATKAPDKPAEKVADLPEKDEKPGKANSAEREAAAKAKEEITRLQKELAEAKAEAARQLAEARGGEKDARDEKEKLLRDKNDASKQLADLRAAEKSLRDEKEKLLRDKDDASKQLADLRAAEKSLRDEKEKLLKDKSGIEAQLREARALLDKERQGRESERQGRQSEQQQRERLLAGPDLPAAVPDALHCPLTDEARAGRDLYFHCATQPSVKEKAVVLYFKPSGSLAWNALSMERSKKGWYAVAIPAARVTGKTLHYYVEARSARDDVAATNGKSGSPNILTLMPPGKDAAGGGELLAQSSAAAKPASAVAGNTPKRVARGKRR